jgi:hypothetical protein
VGDGALKKVLVLVTTGALTLGRVVVGRGVEELEDEEEEDVDELELVLEVDDEVEELEELEEELEEVVVGAGGVVDDDDEVVRKPKRGSGDGSALGLPPPPIAVGENLGNSQFHGSGRRRWRRIPCPESIFHSKKRA